MEAHLFLLVPEPDALAHCHPSGWCDGPHLGLCLIRGTQHHACTGHSVHAALSLPADQCVVLKFELLITGCLKSPGPVQSSRPAVFLPLVVFTRDHACDSAPRPAQGSCLLIWRLPAVLLPHAMVPYMFHHVFSDSAPQMLPSFTACGAAILCEA